MIGALFSSPPETPQLLVGQTKIDFRAAQAFIADLYANAGLELPEQFDPVEEIVKVVLALREQGKITEESQ
jgi:hypothetical protein